MEPEEKEGADAHLRAQNLWPSIDSALADLTVCDPACGSGSFLVGMLHVLDDLQGRKVFSPRTHILHIALKELAIIHSVAGQ